MAYPKVVGRFFVTLVLVFCGAACSEPKTVRFALLGPCSVDFRLPADFEMLVPELHWWQGRKSRDYQNDLFLVRSDTTVALTKVFQEKGIEPDYIQYSDEESVTLESSAELGLWKQGSGILPPGVSLLGLNKNPGHISGAAIGLLSCGDTAGDSALLIFAIVERKEQHEVDARLAEYRRAFATAIVASGYAAIQRGHERDSRLQ